MSIQRPFSSNEINNLHDILQKNGWSLDTSNRNNCQYSLKKEKLIIFTIKFPVPFPIRINIPLEIVNFRLSIAFKIWDLNQNTNTLILYLIKMLRDLAIQVSIEHSLPVEGKETRDTQRSRISSLNLSDTGGHEYDRVGLQTIRQRLGDCKRCKLHSRRRNIVFGAGNENARLVFVGEAPGRDEDIKGEPFIGKAGQLLSRIIKAIHLNRKEIYITN